MTDNASTHRDLDAAPDDVWGAISDADRLGEWLDADVDVEITEGSEGTIVFREGEADPALVLIDTVEEGRRLVFRWASTTAAPTEVEIELEERASGTRVRIVERVLPNGTTSRSIAEASVNRGRLVGAR